LLGEEPMKPEEARQRIEVAIEQYGLQAGPFAVED
jgi:hypothetical protein